MEKGKLTINIQKLIALLEVSNAEFVVIDDVRERRTDAIAILKNMVAEGKKDYEFIIEDSIQVYSSMHGEI